jgi:flagellin
LRLRELAEQSLNGTLMDTERTYLDSEYTALLSEIDRIAASTQFNGINLLSGAGGSINIQVGIGTAAHDSIAVDLATNRDSTTLGLAAGIDSVVNATTAMGQISTAIDTVSGARSDFGAIQNRLDSSIRNINNQAENLSAANSRIRDVDVAAETSRLTSFQILQQAGIAMLSQANMTTGLAMALLQ